VLQDEAVERVLVFTRTKHGADKVVRHLARAGVQAMAIHGNKSQPQRERALAAFRSGASRVLVATDIAARGIDVDGVTHVINFELPNVPESYVHRIGRTARAGAAGVAISFCNDEERAYLRDIERLTRMKLKVEPLPAGVTTLSSGARVKAAPSSADADHGRSNPRPRQPVQKWAPEAEGRTGRNKRGRRKRPQGGSAPNPVSTLPGFVLNPARERRA
jgi:ATP-dependent RNA helicase RhlE